MKVFLGADHRGWELKNQLHSWLENKQYEIEDLGAFAANPDDDYPDFAAVVGEAVAREAGALGIVICGSGAGMSAAANKIPGVRCALMHDAAQVRAARHDDDINILALGADYLNSDQAKLLAESFLATAYAPAAKYQRRLEKISALEKKYSN